MHPKSCQAQIAENLRYLRRVFGYTQSDVAQAIHICRCTYAQYEAGRKMPSIETLLDLSHFYGISIDTILETSRRGLTGLLFHADRAGTDFTRLLSIFGRLTDAQQRFLLRMAKTLVSREQADR